MQIVLVGPVGQVLGALVGSSHYPPLTIPTGFGLLENRWSAFVDSRSAVWMKRSALPLVFSGYGLPMRMIGHDVGGRHPQTESQSGDGGFQEGRGADGFLGLA